MKMYDGGFAAVVADEADFGCGTGMGSIEDYNQRFADLRMVGIVVRNSLYAPV